MERRGAGEGVLVTSFMCDEIVLLSAKLAYAVAFRRGVLQYAPMGML